VNLVLLHRLIDNQPVGEVPDNVFDRELVSLVPSEYAVNVPLENSWIGKTIYDLQLDHGVLTSFDMKKPAEVVEIARLPLDVTGELVTLLTKFIQLKIDMVGKANEYAEAKIKLAETEFKMDQLTKEQEKKVLALEKELAEAKFELEQLSKAQEWSVIVKELEFQKEILSLQKENIQKASEIQTALIDQINLARVADLKHEKTIAELKAEISGKIAEIKQNQENIAKLEQRIKEITDGE